MVVTHALPIANLLVTWPNVTLRLLGGVVRPGLWPRSATGPRTTSRRLRRRGLPRHNGITATRGLTTPDVGEAAVKRALIAVARRTVVLADQTKFGREVFAHVCDLDAIDTVISDIGLDDEWLRRSRTRDDDGPDMILTVTLNPGLDRTIELDRLDRGSVHPAGH